MEGFLLYFCIANGFIFLKKTQNVTYCSYCKVSTLMRLNVAAVCCTTSASWIFNLQPRSKQLHTRVFDPPL